MLFWTFLILSSFGLVWPSESQFASKAKSQVSWTSKLSEPPPGKSSGWPHKHALNLVHFSNKSVTCNDGSPAGYYIRKSQSLYGSSNKTWIIFLEGGWYCYDELSCQHRWMRMRSFMSSVGWPKTRVVGGVLSPNPSENPYWWNINHVYAPYCSSDTWSGTSSSSHFKFMGAIIIEEIVQSLIRNEGFDAESHLILAGSSAGGTGVMLNLDRIDTLLRKHFDGGSLTSPRVRVRGISDSGWFIDPSFGKKNTVQLSPDDCTKDFCPPKVSLQMGMKMWSSRLPEDCQYSSENPVACFFGVKIYPTLRSPLFIFQWLFDEAQMMLSNLQFKPNPALRKEEWDFVYRLGDELKKTLENVTSVMIPSCISHGILTNPEFRSISVNSVFLPRALKCWESGGIVEESNFIPYGRWGGGGGGGADARESSLSNLNEGGSDGGQGGVGVHSNDSRRHRLRHFKRLHHHRRKQRRKSRRQRVRNGTGPGRKHNKKKRNKQFGHKKMRREREHWLTLCDSTDSLRLIEKCSWPQCNKACPKLLNPQTGEEVDFKDLLRSFGLDMSTMAKALGVDLPTLNSMEHRVLLQMLTQHS